MTYEETQKIKHLREVTSVMVEKSSNGIECTKIDNDIPYIRKKYYGKNLWVVL